MKKTEKFSLILGSQSPRRKELFEYLSIPFEVRVSDADEPEWSGELAADYTLKLARLKMEGLRSKLKDNELLITSDTTVSIGEKILNKPNDRKHAEEMISTMSGKTHQVCTSFSISNSEEEVYSESVTSNVECRELTPIDLSLYLDWNEYSDKAGAYGIQGAALSFIKRIEGSYSNIVGFPIDYLVEYFKRDIGPEWRKQFV